jgi:hypothetical protein
MEDSPYIGKNCKLTAAIAFIRNIIYSRLPFSTFNFDLLILN